MKYMNYYSDYCSDCGKLLSDEELDEGVCQVCLDTTHNKYGYGQTTNALAAWQANKDRIKAEREAEAKPIEVVQQSIRKFKIK